MSNHRDPIFVRLDAAEATIAAVRTMLEDYEGYAEYYDKRVREYGIIGIGALYARDRDKAREVVRRLRNALGEPDADPDS